MKFNIDAENINRVIEAINNAPPERFIMSQYMSDRVNLCKTAACIAGWTIIACDIEEYRLCKQMGYNYVIEYSATYRLLKDGKELMAPSADMNNLEELFVSPLFRMRGPSFSVEEFIEIIYHYIPEAIRKNCESAIVRHQEFTHWELFDYLPAEARKAAAIKVLEHLRDTGEIDWMLAVKHGVATIPVTGA